MKKFSAAIILLSLFTLPAHADVVTTKDGARLTGKIVHIGDNVITLETPYAGELSIEKAQVSSFSTDEPVFLRLQSGTTMAGVVQSDASGKLSIQSEDGMLITTPEKVKQSWRPGDNDPQLAEVQSSMRKWKYKAGVDINGKSGNSDEFGTRIKVDAKLTGPNDELHFYGSIDRQEKNSKKTSDETIGGVAYDSYVYKDWGWYVREELENDEFEEIDLRSTSAGGLTYRIINKPRQKLRGRLGLAYLYESYTTNRDEQATSLDLGAYHRYKDEAEYYEVETDVTLLPSLEGGGGYLLSHDSGVEVPLGKDFWKLRIGVTNDYNSDPNPGRDKLDTTYYTRMLLEWE